MSQLSLLFGGPRVTQDTGCLGPMLAKPLADQKRVIILLLGVSDERQNPFVACISSPLIHPKICQELKCSPTVL